MGAYSKRLELSTRGPQNGYCAICGKFGKLSKDHVPPAGCGNDADVILKTLFAGEPSSKGYRASQGGLHFKTLCEICNSSLLGRTYDPELIDLAKSIESHARALGRSRLILPKEKFVFVKPQKIARSVVGHLLAAHSVDECRSGLKSAPFVDSLRAYFLNDKAAMPEKLEIYYWIYPRKDNVIIKNFARVSLASKHILFGHVIKFMPLAFWLIWERPEDEKVFLPLLVPDREMELDQISQIQLDFAHVPPRNFPEAPTDGGIGLFVDHQTSVSSLRRNA